MSILYVQTPTLYLSGAGVIVGATSVSLTNLVDIYGNVLTMTDFGSVGYITLEPDTTNAEGATFTGITANANGTYTLTGVKTLLAKSPYTETSGLVRNHTGGTKVVVTDNVGFWNTFGNKNNTNTWAATQTFTVAPVSANQPTLSTEVANKAYVDGVAIAGASNAATDVKGIAYLSVAAASTTGPIVVGDNDPRVPTQEENDALVGDLGTPSATNLYVTQQGFIKNAEKYGEDSGGNDTYVVSLPVAPSAYATGMVVVFKANTANTGAATLNVNSLGAKTIVKGVNTTLSDGDIGGSQLITVVYNGTNFVIQSNVSPTIKTGNTTKDMSSDTTTTIAHGLGKIPKFVRINVNAAISANTGITGSQVYSYGCFDGTTQNCIYSAVSTTGPNSNSAIDTTYGVHYAYGANTTDNDQLKGTISFDLTNITITWTKQSSPTGTGNIIWEAIG